MFHPRTRRSSPGGPSASTSSLALLGAAGITLTAAAVTLTLAGRSPDRGLSAAIEGLVVALPVTVGLVALRRRRDDRYALLLAGAGLLWSTTALAESTAAVPYSLGRVALWVAEPVLVYLLLAFPSGRVSTAGERRTALAVATVAAVLYLPTALLVQHYPLPSPWAGCGTDCPPNALALTSSTPAFVDDVMRPLRELATVAIYLVVTAILARRAAAAGPLQRRALLPVVATAALRMLAIAAYFLLRRADAAAAGADWIGWLYMLSLPVVALGFAGGLVARRLYVATALQRLAGDLRVHAGAAELQAAMAGALEDSTLRIVHWLPGEPGHWLDESGWPVPAPGGRGRAVTEIVSEGRRVGAIEHDAALAQDPALLEAAASYSVAVLENRRLVGELRDSLRELSQSRARLVAVADDTRRRIERDLHDGAQQRLIALRMRLTMEAERLRDEAPAAADELERLGEEVGETIDEVRDLAHGIYPSLLAERGLGDALRAAARTAPIPTSVDADGIGRYRPEVESTVYFACVEALQNAAKHAGGASRVQIALAANGRLEFEVRDDGAGFEAPADGRALTHLRDRLTAVGGALRVESAGGGTRVVGSVPFDAARR